MPDNDKPLGLSFPFFGRILGPAVLLGLYLVSRENYLLFHSLAEVFSVVVAWGVFMVAWTARANLKNHYFLVIGVAFVFIGFMDLFHTLSYRGMGIMPFQEANHATQLWIAARFFQAAVFAAAPFFIRRKIRAWLILLVFTGITALVFLSIFLWNVFPTCYVEGLGLTRFKIVAEYAICALFILAGALLHKNRSEFGSGVYRLLMLSLAFSIAAELAFTLYISVYGVSNLIGHFFKIIAFYLVFMAIVQTGIQRPYDLIFRELKQKEEALAQNEYKYRALFTNMGNAAAVYQAVDNGRDFVFADFNRSAERIDRIEKKDVLGQRMTRIFPGAEEFGILEVLRRVHETGAPEELPAAQYRDGRITGWRENFVYRLPGGEVVAVYTDVTDRQEQIRRRLAHIERLGNLLRAAERVLAAENVPDLLESAVKAAREITGARLAVANHFFERDRFQLGAVSRAGDAPICPQGTDFTVKNGGVYLTLLEKRHTLRLTDEKLRAHPEWKGLPGGHTPLRGLLGARMSGGEGQGIGMILTSDKEGGRDFTAEDEALLAQLAALASLGLRHITAREETRQQADRLEAVLKAVPVAVWIATDTSCRKVNTNPAARRLFRFGDDPSPALLPLAENKDRAFILCRQDKPLEDEEIPLCVAANENREVGGVEVELKYRDGEIRYLYGNAAPLRDPEGRAAGAVSAFMDVTELERVRRDLEEARNNLEDRVAQRTRELSQSNQLLKREIDRHRKTSEMLEQAEKEVRAMSQHILEIQEIERKLVAQEVHDGIGASLAAVKFGLERITKAAETHLTDKGLEIFRETVRILQKTMEDTRRIARDLWPAILEDLGLFAGISEFVREFGNVHPDILVDTRLAAEEGSVPRALHIVIYRLIQEALTNAAAHAKAKKVAIELGTGNNLLFLAVSDDGKGFDSNRVLSGLSKRPGLGLISMQERVDLSGGVFVVKSEEGRGTTIRAMWSTDPDKAEPQSLSETAQQAKEDQAQPKK